MAADLANNVAKAILCKNRHDSFAAAVEGAEPSVDDAIICKWRTDSFAAAQAERQELSSADFAAAARRQRQGVPPHQAPVERRHSAPNSWQQEAAYLQALAEQRDGNTLERSVSRDRRDSVSGQRQLTGDCESRMRIDAMELATKEAAIRAKLEEEMRTACNAQGTMLLSYTAPVQNLIHSISHTSSPAASPSPMRARRGSMQPGQLQGRRSNTPRSRNSVHMKPHAQPLVATAVAGGSVGSSSHISRTGSFGGDSFRQAADAVKAATMETLRTAESFRQAGFSPIQQRSDSFHSPRARRVSSFIRVDRTASPTPRSMSFQNSVSLQPIITLDSTRVPSPARSRASSVSISGGVLSRSSSVDVQPALVSRLAAPSSPMPQSARIPPQTSFVPSHAVPNAEAMQRAAAMVEEQAQLAARLNVAAEMIDNLVMDSSVLEEAKRLTSAVAQRQQNQRRQQPAPRRQSMSPPPAPANVSQPRQAPSRRPSSVFWKPPPDAARLCARCPSLDALPARRTVSNTSFNSRTSIRLGV